MPIVGYLVSSHVAQNHIATPMLIKSMLDCGIEAERILVIVNGATTERDIRCRSVHYAFRHDDARNHLGYCASEGWGKRLGITHWFFINGTSRCGPQFKSKVEGGFDPDADATRATDRLMPRTALCNQDKPINDLAMYRDGYLVSIAQTLIGMDITSAHAIAEFEGLAFGLAPKKAVYSMPPPDSAYQVSGPSDIYGTGTARITEYFPQIDWFRYKKNWGQLTPGTYDPTAL